MRFRLWLANLMRHWACKIDGKMSITANDVEQLTDMHITFVGPGGGGGSDDRVAQRGANNAAP